MGNLLGYCPSGQLFSCLPKQSFWIDKHHLLPALGADGDTVTASGFSSGAYMSSYLQIIYSDRIKGIGFHEGGTYYGGEFYGRLDEVTNQTIADFAISSADSNMASGLIADLTNLKDSPVYITAG